MIIDEHVDISIKINCILYDRSEIGEPLSELKQDPTMQVINLSQRAFSDISFDLYQEDTGYNGSIRIGRTELAKALLELVRSVVGKLEFTVKKN